MPDNPPRKKIQKNLNNATHYSGIGFQMIVIILAGTFGGIKLDQKSTREFPLFTIILSLLAVILAMFIMMKDFIIKK